MKRKAREESVKNLPTILYPLFSLPPHQTDVMFFQTA